MASKRRAGTARADRDGPAMRQRLLDAAVECLIELGVAGTTTLAVQRGARQHHWNFGDMPPQPQVTPEEIRAIIRFVREVQEANGIR